VQADVLEAAALVDSLAPKLSPEKRYALACAPVDLREHFFLSAYTSWIETLGAGRTVSFPRRMTDEDRGGLEGLEDTLKLITLYRWLALKFPGSFTDQAYVSQLRREATEQIPRHPAPQLGQIRLRADRMRRLRPGAAAQFAPSHLPECYRGGSS